MEIIWNHSLLHYLHLLTITIVSLHFNSYFQLNSHFFWIFFQHFLSIFTFFVTKIFREKSRLFVFILRLLPWQQDFHAVRACKLYCYECVQILIKNWFLPSEHYTFVESCSRGRIFFSVYKVWQTFSEKSLIFEFNFLLELFFGRKISISWLPKKYPFYILGLRD
jgi:hypothetical protein